MIYSGYEVSCGRLGGQFHSRRARLSVTQPTLSAQVKALEDDYGVALFDRRGAALS
jgi:DNA-binding transcriptional LysR family regulator